MYIKTRKANIDKKRKKSKINFTKKNRRIMIGGDPDIENLDGLYNELFVNLFEQRYQTFDKLNTVNLQELMKYYPKFSKSLKSSSIMKHGISFHFDESRKTKNESELKLELEDLLEKEKEYLDKTKMGNFGEVNLVYQRFHGKYADENTKFFIVPENTYICNLTTLGLNSFLSSKDYDTEYNIINTFNNLTIDQFKKICLHRGNLTRLDVDNEYSLSQSRTNKNFNTLLNCFINSSWYYPGQPCYDIKLSYGYGDISEDYSKHTESESNYKCKRFYMNDKKLITDYYQKYINVYEEIRDKKNKTTIFLTDLSKYVHDLVLNFKNKKYTILVLTNCRSISEKVPIEKINEIISYESLNMYMISHLNLVKDLKISDKNVLDNVLYGNMKFLLDLNNGEIQKLRIINQNYNLPIYVDKINKIFIRFEKLYEESDVELTKFLRGCLLYVGNYDFNVYYYFLKNIIFSNNIKDENKNKLLYYFFEVNYEKINLFFSYILKYKFDSLVRFKEDIEEYVKSICNLYSIYREFLKNQSYDKELETRPKKKLIEEFIKNELIKLSAGDQTLCPEVSEKEELEISNGSDLRETDLFDIRNLKILDKNTNFKDIYYKATEIEFSGEDMEFETIKYYLQIINQSRIKKIRIYNCNLLLSDFLKFVYNDKILFQFEKTDIQTFEIFKIKNCVISNQDVGILYIFDQLENLSIDGHLPIIYNNCSKDYTIIKLVLTNCRVDKGYDEILKIKNLYIKNATGPSVEVKNIQIMNCLDKNSEIKIDGLNILNDLEDLIDYLLKKEIGKIFLKNINKKVNMSKIKKIFKTHQDKYFKDDLKIINDTVEITSIHYKVNRVLSF